MLSGARLVLVLRNTLVSGRRAGLQTSMAVLSGNLVHITLLMLGIGLPVTRFSPEREGAGG